MKKKCIVFIFSILIVFQMPFSTFATLQNLQYVVDNADILTDAEHIELESIAREISSTYDVDVFIMLEDALNGETVQSYAESLYNETDRNWKGYWSSSHAILFLLTMEEREWHISTAGNALYIFTDYGLYSLEEAFVSYLSDGAYFEALSSYLTLLPEYFEAYNNGTPIDGFLPGDLYEASNDKVYYEEEQGINWILSIGIGLIAAVASILLMIGAMNTKRRQHSAGNYLQSGSYQLKRHSDIFLYSNVTKVRRQENNNNHGGSSTHRGSGGVKHGGRGGKF